MEADDEVVVIPAMPSSSRAPTLRRPTSIPPVQTMDGPSRGKALQTFSRHEIAPPCEEGESFVLLRPRLGLRTWSYDVEVARELIKLLLPQDWEEWKSHPLDEINFSFFLTLIEVSCSYFVLSCRVSFLITNFNFFLNAAHDITLVQKGFSGFAQLGHSLNDKVEAIEDWTKVAKEVLKVFEERELKLQEFSTSQNIIQELEARVAKKKEIIAKRQAYAIELETRLDNIRILLQVAKE